MSTEKRKYELKVRADRQRATRERIVEATMQLHQEVGPAATTVAEIARRAGVQRLTVYNHFPDEAQLFGACQAHWIALHPPPDFAAALALDEPLERVRAVLRGFYAWCRETESMTENVQRDRASLPALDALLRDTADAAAHEMADALATGLAPRGGAAARSRVRVLVRVALEFWTWHRLIAEGLGDDAAADLMTDVVGRAAT